MIALLLGMALADCPEQPGLVLDAAARDVEMAFVDIDEAAFATARRQLESALPCVVAPLDLSAALRLHRAHALIDFAEGDRIAAQRSFNAIKRLDPSWDPTASLFGTQHPLYTLWERAEFDGVSVRVELAPPGGWVVDGNATSSVPSGASFVLQGLSRSGEVVLTGYYDSVSEIPLSNLEALAARPRIPASRRRGRAIGSVASGAVLVGAGAFLIAAQQTASGLDSIDVSEVPAAEQRIQTYSTLAGVLGGVGLVGGIVTWTVHW